MCIRDSDYSYRLPRKAIRLATRMALAGKIQDEQVVVLDSLSMDAPKTSVVAKMLKGMGLEGSTALITTAVTHRTYTRVLATFLALKFCKRQT